jgi:hypothetical protein
MRPETPPVETEPRTDLAWKYALGPDVLDPVRRTLEFRNWLDTEVMCGWAAPGTQFEQTTYGRVHSCVRLIGEHALRARVEGFYSALVPATHRRPAHGGHPPTTSPRQPHTSQSGNQSRQARRFTLRGPNAAFAAGSGRSRRYHRIAGVDPEAPFATTLVEGRTAREADIRAGVASL